MNDKSPPHFPRGIYAFVGDTLKTKGSLVEQVELLLAAGIKCLQIRLKAMVSEAYALEQMVKAVECAQAGGALCLVNDRVDMALLACASGVHLGEEDMPVPVARRLLGRGVLIGKTVRSLEQAQLAKEEGADYVGLGPIFATRSKFLPIAALGVEVLGQVVKHSPLPVVAIGGISVSNMAEVAGTGVHAAAVISEIWQAAKPGQRALELQGLFAKAMPS
ncbi:MAG: thiamine phosphate synthase [Cystobacterineae bacterium]|nr:thiamine phosphate synthase [Cystobacterineae bacterium]